MRCISHIRIAAYFLQERTHEKGKNEVRLRELLYDEKLQPIVDCPRHDAHICSNATLHEFCASGTDKAR